MLITMNAGCWEVCVFRTTCNIVIAGIDITELHFYTTNEKARTKFRGTGELD